MQKWRSYGVIIIMLAVFILLMYTWWQGESMKINGENANVESSSRINDATEENGGNAANIEPAMADKIRVLIMTDNYEGIYHEEIRITSDGTFTVKCGDKTETYEGGKEAVITRESFFGDDVVYVEADDTESGENLLKLSSLKRGYDIPSYHGMFEIVNTDMGMRIINELPLEEYLYSVVASEMPASYGLEALKAQAVCARSYAYKQILNNSLYKYGAHVNDSAQYQVYNNAPETSIVIEAVDATKGQIITYGGEVVEAFYFSTSCGHTTDADIWSGGNISYIQGKLTDGSNAKMIFDTEDKFTAFIKDRNFESYDMGFAWYRWEVEFSFEDLTKFAKNAGLSDDIGSVKSIVVLERGTGGVVKRLKINGSNGSVILEKEYAIRKFFNPQGVEIERADGTVVNNFSLLPSAYFAVEPVFTGTEFTGYHIYGGGFGHGAGMSQNGAKAMTDSGISYDDVLKYFFEGINISNCYAY